MDKDFTKGIKVFSPIDGIGEILCVFNDGTMKVKFNDKYRDLYAGGKLCAYDTRPFIYPLSEALKLFPMWLEEVEERTGFRTLYGVYDKHSGTMESLAFEEKSNCIKYMGKFGGDDSFEIVEICVPTNRKVIRERQQ